jgi:hypothetical protein
MECWSIGVLECCLIENLRISLNIPILHYSRKRCYRDDILIITP